MGRLFWKFFFFIWLAQLTGILGVAGTFWLREQSLSRKQETIDTSPPAVAHVELAEKTLRYEGPQAVLALLKRSAHTLRVVVDGQDQDLLGRPVSATTLAQARQALSDATGPAREWRMADGTGYLVFLARLENPSRDDFPPPGGDRPPHPREKKDLIPQLPLLTALVASFLFAVLLAWYFAKPIRNLRRAFDALAAGNLGIRIAGSMGQRRDELADLGHDFDLMAGRLQALMDGQRRLLHDVSHEMRSPLARLQVAIGLARQQPEKFDASMTRIERESERMDRLVGELLTLSRLDAGVESGAPENIPMQGLVEVVVEDACFEAEASARHVELGRNDEVVLVGQPELLHRALENVVRNAIRYSPPSGVVSVESRVNFADKTLTVAVQDQGCGVAESELEAIFEPFNRGGKAAGADGHGLGLAIAQRVIRAHGGSIRAFNRPEGGLCVEMIFPIKG